MSAAGSVRTSAKSDIFLLEEFYDDDISSNNKGPLQLFEKTVVKDYSIDSNQDTLASSPH